MDSLCFPIMLHYHTFQVTLSIYVSLFPISLPFLLNSLVPLLWSFSPSCLKLQIIHSTLTNHMYRAELAGSVSCATPGAFSCFSLFISPRCFFLPPILLLLCLVLCSSPSGNPVVKSGKDWLHERMSAGRSCPWNIQVRLSLSPLPLSPLTFSFSFSLSASLLFFLALRSQYWNDSVIWIISWATLIYFFSQHTLHEISVIARTSSRICQKSFDIFL